MPILRMPSWSARV